MIKVGNEKLTPRVMAKKLLSAAISELGEGQWDNRSWDFLSLTWAEQGHLTDRERKNVTDQVDKLITSLKKKL